jgi:trk system potassium uptake protein TrkA
MKQFAVIGLGNFGYYLATQLYKKGYEVLAIDKKPNLVQEIKDSVSQAIVADATDRKALEAMGLQETDAAVVCIGSVLSNSILATLNLKDIGVKRVLAKALSEEHGRILYKIGASEVFFPEKDLALSMAERIHNPNMIEYLPFLEGYSIIEISPTKDFIGKSLRDLDLINQFGIQIIAVKEVVGDRLNLIPTAKFVIKDSDILIMIGPNESLEKLKRK